VQEVLACFERIRPRLKLTPSGGRSRKAGPGAPAIPVAGPAPEE